MAEQGEVINRPAAEARGQEDSDDRSPHHQNVQAGSSQGLVPLQSAVPDCELELQAECGTEPACIEASVPVESAQLTERADAEHLVEDGHLCDGGEAVIVGGGWADLERTGNGQQTSPSSGALHIDEIQILGRGEFDNSYTAAVEVQIEKRARMLGGFRSDPQECLREWSDYHHHRQDRCQNVHNGGPGSESHKLRPHARDHSQEPDTTEQEDSEEPDAIGISTKSDWPTYWF